MTAYSFKQRQLSKLLGAAALGTTLLLGGCNEVAQPGMDYNKHIKRGESYLQQGQFNAAIIEAKNAIQKAPEELTTHVFLATILLEMGQAKSALIQLEQIPDNTTPAYLFTKAEAYNDLRKFISAEKLLTNNEAILTAADNNRYLKLAAASQLGQRNIEQAQLLLQQLLQNSPEDSDVLVSLAKAAAMKGNADLTQQYLTQALEKSPNNTDALLLKANIQYGNNQLSAAEDTLTIALSALESTDTITPQRATILGRLADILTQQGRSTEALIYTRILAEALPGQIELKSKFDRALRLLKEEKLDEAEILLEELVAEAPNYHSAGQILGIIKYNRGELEAANQYFTSSIDPEIAPENATMAFAMTNMRLNNPEKVLELLEDQINHTQSPELLGLYGLAALSADQAPKGEQALLKALQLDPGKSRLSMALAQMYNKQNQYQKALEQLQQGYQTTPADPYLQKALISQYIGLKQTAQANQLVADINKKYSDNINSLLLVGNYQNFFGDRAQAIKILQQALALDPNHIETLSALGRTLIQANKLDQATEHYRNMITRQPEVAIGYKGLISALEIQQKKQQAIDEVTGLATTADNPTPYAVLIEFYAINNDFKTANQLLSTTQARFPKNTQVDQLSIQLAAAEATAALGAKDLLAARSAIMKGLQLNPDDIRLQTLLVNTEVAAKNYREASKITEQLAPINGNLAMLLRGDIATAEQKYPNALNHYQTLWKKQPSDSLAQRIYSNYSNQKKTAEANAFLQQWAEKLPQSISLLTIRSANEISNENYDEAIRDLVKALEQQKNNPSPLLLNNLAWAYLQSGNLEAAKQNAKKAYDLAPKSAAVADTYGWILLKTGNTNEAKKILKIAYDLAPDNAEIAEHLKQANQS